MYLIAERLRRPMRNQFGGKWVSMFGLLPVVGAIMFAFVHWTVALAIMLTFPIMIFVTWYRHNRDASRRRRVLKDDTNVNKSFIGSWF
jgi:ABC-type transport system involved in cytochrome bd biosynthesis fused ATPase/permease subunit